MNDANPAPSRIEADRHTQEPGRQQLPSDELMHVERHLDSQGLAARVAVAVQYLLSGLHDVQDRQQTRTGAAAPDRYAGAARPLSDALRRGDRLVARLLSYAGCRQMTPGKIEPLEFLSHFARVLRSALDLNIAVSVDVASDCPPCEADARVLEEVLLDLVANSRDAMPEGGRLRFSACERLAPDGTPAVAIAISDSGHGMSDELLRHATEPFVTARRDDPLTGLSLAAADGFARQTGGCMTLSSVTGEGTTVTLFLPVRTADR